MTGDIYAAAVWYGTTKPHGHKGAGRISRGCKDPLCTMPPVPRPAISALTGDGGLTCLRLQTIKLAQCYAGEQRAAKGYAIRRQHVKQPHAGQACSARLALGAMHADPLDMHVCSCRSAPCTQAR